MLTLEYIAHAGAHDDNLGISGRQAQRNPVPIHMQTGTQPASYFGVMGNFLAT
jgi:hypothetical protein